MPPKKRTVLKEISLEHLNLEDVFCIACRGIFVQPVTMPCGHTLCLECFKSTVNQNAYQCPTCRMRISNWLRKYKHNWESLVNNNLWKALQLQYPIEVQKKLNDEDDGIGERITRNGFTHVVQTQEGEIKKEFDSMIINIQQEQKKKELQDLQLAKELQEAEEAYKITSKAANDKLTKDDIHLASAIQEEIQKELREKEEIEEEYNRRLALQLQEKISSEFKETKAYHFNKTISTCIKLPKKGPLDKMFAKSTSNNYKALYSSSDYGTLSSNSFSSSSTSSSSGFRSGLSTSSSVTDPCSSFSLSNPCSSFTVTNPLINLSVTDSGVLEDDNLDTCSCGRLEDNFNSSLPPCHFCSHQISLLDKICTQNKNDFLMAKKLQETFQKENFDDYNLRKRSASPLQKSYKVPKKQQTLAEALNKSYKR